MNWSKIERLFGKRFLPPEAMLVRVHADRDRTQMGRRNSLDTREWGVRIEASDLSVNARGSRPSVPGQSLRRDVS